MSGLPQRTIGIGILVLVALVALGGLAYVLIPSAADVALGLDRAQTREAEELVPIADSESLAAVTLDAQNTTVAFGCAKTVAGKTSVVRGGWSGRFGSNITGKALLDPTTHEPRQLEAEIAVATLWTEHDQLTESLLTQGFFQPEQHPTATFISTRIEPGVAETTAMADATHTVTGNFTLNGITRSISFPAQVAVEGGRLQVESEFSLDRHAFEVEFADGAGYGLLTDENIADRVALELEIDAEVPGGLGEESTQVAEVTEPVDKATEVASPVGPVEQAEPVETVAPESVELVSAFEETIPATQVSFDMVLVPGDPAAGIEPFYIGQHEVTWDEFLPWAQGRDLGEDESRLGEERALKLRPSAPYGSVDRNFGIYKRPALSMSRLSAELYCQWLSEQTGRTYRLPTEAEWERAYRLGGADPAEALSAEAAAESAVFVDNSWSDSIGDWATRQVGETEPNDLDIYDMAGNVAEWVTQTGDDRVARGGHFEAPLAELGVGRYIEDPDDWNRDYPNDPKSIWWFVNARWVGFRVVCDVTSATPGTPASPGAAAASN